MISIALPIVWRLKIEELKNAYRKRGLDSLYQLDHPLAHITLFETAVFLFPLLRKLVFTTRANSFPCPPIQMMCAPMPATFIPLPVWYCSSGTVCRQRLEKSLCPMSFRSGWYIHVSHVEALLMERTWIKSSWARRIWAVLCCASGELLLSSTAHLSKEILIRIKRAREIFCGVSVAGCTNRRICRRCHSNRSRQRNAVTTTNARWTVFCLCTLGLSFILARTHTHRCSQ